jgi:hypothetical protein
MIKGADPPEGGKLQMQKSKALFRTGLIAILILSIFLCSFATGMVQQSSIPGKQIPTVPPIVATLPTPIGGQTPVATPISTMAPVGSSIFVEGNWLVIGSERYPIGDEFLDASEIPLGASTKTLTGGFGYADIRGIEDLILLWITDNEGIKRYIIVESTDSLFVGHKGVEDGFIHYLNLLREAEEDTLFSFGAVWGTAGGAIAVQLLACGPTAGTSCLTALITALGAGIGFLLKQGYHYLFGVLPNIDNLRDQFGEIDDLRPKAP